MTKSNVIAISFASFTAAAVLTASSTFATVLVDEFDGPTLDLAKWTPSFAFGNSALNQGGGVLSIVNRGRITAVPMFGDSMITGTVQLNQSLDAFAVVIRSDGSFAPAFGESATGVRVSFRPLNNPDNNAAVSVRDIDQNQALGHASANIQIGVPFDFMVNDLGGEISVFVDDMANPVLVVNSTSDSGDTIIFHNRERVLADLQADIDWLQLESLELESEVLTVRVSRGEISWEDEAMDGTYDIEFASHPQGPWYSSWSIFTDIPATGGIISRPLPRFFRIRRHYYPAP
jgi:hypothetical protein